jgi:hypothetical protein
MNKWAVFFLFFRRWLGRRFLADCRNLGILLFLRNLCLLCLLCGSLFGWGFVLS